MRTDFGLRSDDRDENVEDIVEEIGGMLHPKAKEEFSRDQKAVEQVKLWLRKRMNALEIGRGDLVSLFLNPWNERGFGFGFQSVSLAFKQRTGGGQHQEVRHEYEWKSPTIGVVADGLVEQPFKMAEARFPVGKGRGEALYSCSEDLKMDGEKDGDVQQLKRGGYTLVEGPDAVRTYMQIRDASPERVREVVNRGVYTCCFINTGEADLIDDKDTTAIIE